MTDQPEQPDKPEEIDEFAEFRQLPESGADSDQTDQPAPEAGKEYDLSGVDLTDNSGEEEAVRAYNKEKGKPEGTTKPDWKELAVQNPPLMEKVTDKKEEIMRDTFSVAYEDLGKITVTDVEKDRFLRAALHDTPMQFDIFVPATGSLVKTSIPADQFTSWAIGALKSWEECGQIDPKSTVQWILGFQQMHAFLQIDSVDNIPMPWAEIRDQLLETPSKLYAHLRDPDNFAVFFRMNDVRWQVLAYVLRVVEIKYKICTEALMSRDFFQAAGTD
jgi:hypothetical protein